MPVTITDWVNAFTSVLGIAELGTLIAFLAAAALTFRLVRTVRRG